MLETAVAPCTWPSLIHSGACMQFKDNASSVLILTCSAGFLLQVSRQPAKLPLVCPELLPSRCALSPRATSILSSTHVGGGVHATLLIGVYWALCCRCRRRCFLQRPCAIPAKGFPVAAAQSISPLPPFCCRLRLALGGANSSSDTTRCVAPTQPLLVCRHKLLNAAEHHARLQAWGAIRVTWRLVVSLPLRPQWLH
jgi:hypothetical protein